MSQIKDFNKKMGLDTPAPVEEKVEEQVTPEPTPEVVPEPEAPAPETPKEESVVAEEDGNALDKVESEVAGEEIHDKVESEDKVEDTVVADEVKAESDGELKCPKCGCTRVAQEGTECTCEKCGHKWECSSEKSEAKKPVISKSMIEDLETILDNLEPTSDLAKSQKQAIALIKIMKAEK